MRLERHASAGVSGAGLLPAPRSPCSPSSVSTSSLSSQPTPNSEEAFFWVTLTDEASKKDNLLKATQAFQNVLDERIDFRDDWDLIPYFNFRSESEQAVLKGEVYA